MEARDERRLLRLQKQMVGHKLLIIDELGFVPLTRLIHEHQDIGIGFRAA